MANRIETSTPAVPSSQAPASPTGAPWIPAKWVPILFGVCVASEIAAYYLADNSMPDRIAHTITALCGLAGIASPGWRKK